MDMWWIIAAAVGAVIVVALRRRTGKLHSGLAKRKIMQGALVIDVRTPAEYASGHYGGAKSIPVAELHSRIAEIGEKQRPIVVYCASGMRSARAAGLLAAAGFTDVTNAGGLANLGSNGSGPR